MKKVFLLLILGIFSSGMNLHAQQTTKSSSASAVAASAPRPEDEKAIKALLDTFTKAFNAGDAAAAIATYTDSAIVVDEHGERVEGRAAIRNQYAQAFADNAGDKIAVEVEALRFLGPETAIELGRTTITPGGGGAPEKTRFTAIYVKQDGRWLQSVVRDEASHELSPHDRLKDLEWLVGDWVNESEDAVVLTTCKWDASGNFLLRDFTMKTKGQPVLSGSQRIGWDPLKHQFKTWIFDSEGGHGEGYWTHNGNEWVIKVEGVGREGKAISATNIITRLGKDRMSWQSIDRTVGGSAIDGVDAFVLVRTPPEAGK